MEKENNGLSFAGLLGVGLSWKEKTNDCRGREQQKNWSSRLKGSQQISSLRNPKGKSKDELPKRVQCQMGKTPQIL